MKIFRDLIDLFDYSLRFIRLLEIYKDLDHMMSRDIDMISLDYFDIIIY